MAKKRKERNELRSITGGRKEIVVRIKNINNKEEQMRMKIKNYVKKGDMSNTCFMQIQLGSSTSEKSKLVRFLRQLRKFEKG